jgi:putative hemolysin
MSPFTRPSSVTAAVQAVRIRYRVRLAESAADLRAAQALRFQVFNLELDEGLINSYETGLDADPFDTVCDHLLVEDDAGSVVGTYRMQTGSRASTGLGFYSEREFNLAPLAPMRAQVLELGRACIARAHRNFTVLNLLWKGIASYAERNGTRYLVGCSSLTSQDEADGAAAWKRLLPHLAPPTWRMSPHPAFRCATEPVAGAAPPIPRLLSAYLSLGALICGPPAIDREFKTIDFLTWLDIESPTIRALRQRGRFTA